MSTEHLAAVSTSSSQVETETVVSGVDAEKVHTIEENTPSSLVAKVKKEPKEISPSSNVEDVENIPNRFCNDNESPDMHSCIRTLFDIRRTKEVDGEIPMIATENVALAIASIGRTEDVAISPDGERLAIALFNEGKIYMVRFNIKDDMVEVVSTTMNEAPYLANPHGLMFLDNYTLIIANRNGGLSTVQLDEESGMKVIKGRMLLDHTHPVIHTPSNVEVRHIGDRLAEAFVCNSYANHVSRHLLDADNDWNVLYSEKMINDDLDVPDGVALSNNREWLAVTNHDSHQVFIYSLTADTVHRVGILNNINCPHGLMFANDDRAILVADAGIPFIHVFESNDGDWRGERDLSTSKRVMSDDAYILSRINHTEGGPKGLKVLDDIVIITSESDPLSFFRLQDFVQDENQNQRRSKSKDEEVQSMIEQLGGKLEVTTKQLAIKEEEVDIMKLRVGSIVAVYGDDDDDHDYDMSYRCAIIRKIEPASRAADTRFTVAYEGEKKYTQIQLGDRKFGKCIVQDGKPVVEITDHTPCKEVEQQTTKKGDHDLESILKQLGETLEETTKQLAEKEKEIELMKLKVGSKIAIYKTTSSIGTYSKFHYATVRKIESSADSAADAWFTVLYEGDHDLTRIQLGHHKWEKCELVWQKA